jgi:hypothetical protein
MTKPETNSDHDLTITEWCLKRGISKSSFHKLQHLKRGPKVRRIPGTNLLHITPQADAEWQAAMEELAQQATSRLEQQRRVELAKAAGQAAAASPRHVSKRGPRNSS